MKGFIYCNCKDYLGDEYYLMEQFRELSKRIVNMEEGDCIGIDELFFRDGSIFALYLEDRRIDGRVSFIMRVNDGYLIEHAHSSYIYNHLSYVFTESDNLFLESSFKSIVLPSEVHTLVRQKATLFLDCSNKDWNMVSTIRDNGRIHREENERLCQFIEHKIDSIDFRTTKFIFYRLCVDWEELYEPIELVWIDDKKVAYCESMPPIILGERDENLG